jgi:hypothetical protein
LVPNGEARPGREGRKQVTDPWEQTWCFANSIVYKASREAAELLAIEVRNRGGDEDDFANAVNEFFAYWHERHPSEVWPKGVLH